MTNENNPIPLITPDDPAAHSGDVAGENVATLKALFPQIVSDGKVDFEVLRQLLGDAVDGGEERYGLNWKGKARARAHAVTPTLATLRPAKDESVDWDTTQNLVIEGDNLEVLKTLRKAYASKVKLIYIDPPYNTGSDFVYPDNYTNSLSHYLELTGQTGIDGAQLSSNKEASGRFHTDWLNMMLPRLTLAKDLLRDDGVIFISIDDSEYANCFNILNEIFGEDNFAGTIVWKKKTNGNNMGAIPPVHDYIVCFAKKLCSESIYGFPMSKEDIESTYRNPDDDPRGPWTTSDLSANHEGPYFEIENPVTGEKFLPPAGRYWVFNENEVKKRIADGRIIFGKSGVARPIQKKFLSDRTSMRTLPESWWDSHGMNSDGTEEIAALLEPKIFNHTKPSKLMKHVVNISTTTDDIVLDFFAGSGTTGHAVMAQNAADGGTRRFVLVQLPEVLDPAKKEQKLAADFCDQLNKPRNIAELTKERLRRAGIKIREEHPRAEIDTGFRAYKLHSSNLKPWQPDPDNLEASLLDAVSNIVHGRSEEDLMVELLLKTGIDLTTPTEMRQIAGKDVHALGGGALIVCFADISDDDAEPLGHGLADWQAEIDPASQTTFYFKDMGFASASAKANVAAILRQRLGDKIAKLASI